MGTVTSFTGEVSSDRLTSCPWVGENHLSAKRHGNRRLTPTLWALWPEKDTVTIHLPAKEKEEICLRERCMTKNLFQREVISK